MLNDTHAEPTTAMETAFADAGVKSAAKRLAEATAEVLDAEPEGIDHAADLLLDALGFTDVQRELVGADALQRAARGYLHESFAEAHPAAPKPQPPRANPAAKAAAAQTIGWSLARPTALGKPLGICTREEVVALAHRGRIEASVYEALLHPIPPLGVIGNFWTDADIARIAQEHGAGG